MSARTLLQLLLLSALTLSGVVARADAARFAIVVGNNRPESGETLPLRYADDDALATHQLLREAGVDSVLLARPDSESLQLHPQLAQSLVPSWSELERAAQALFARMRQLRARGTATELLLFYSGHGDVEGGEGYVVLEDARLTRSMLYTLLTRSPAARNHVIIDACKSYFLAFEKGPGGKRSPYPNSFVSAGVPAQLASTGFVLSTSSDRDSHEWERYQAGILSHELRSALRGAADADTDGRVTYAEIGAFLGAANQSITNPRFRPDFLLRPPEDDLRRELLRWTRDESTLQLAETKLGHIYIESASGDRVLDVHPEAQTPLILHLPRQRPLFVRADEETHEYAVEATEPTQIATLTPQSPQIARRSAVHLAFAKLFAVPFGSSDVAAFERAQRADARAPTDVRETLRWRRLRLTSGSIALGAAAAGIALSASALVKYERGADASQVELASLNRDVRRLNVASVVCYALTGIAGASWAWLTWSRGRFVTVEPGSLSAFDRRGLRVSLGSVF